MFSLYVHYFFGLSNFYDFLAGSPPYLCRIPICVASISVSSVSSIMCVTICVSHYVHHMCVIFCDFSSMTKFQTLWWVNLFKYCMDHGCATRKNFSGHDRKFQIDTHVKYKNLSFVQNM